MKNIFREPLLHFLLIGFALFLVYHYASDPAEDNMDRIVVTAGQVEQMKAKFTQTWMRPPGKKEIEGLIESYVRDEVYYREALAMGLDRDDQSVRQRMRLKLEYLLEDLSDLSEPDDDTLAAYMQEHQDSFRLEAQVSFQQVYLNPDKRQDIEVDAATILSQLKQGAPPESLSDLTMVQGEFKLARESNIERQFGEPFAVKR